MGKVKEFITKYSKFIKLFLSISISILFLLIATYLVGLIDITIFITLQNLLFILFSLLSFYTLLRYERSKQKDLFKKVFRGTFLTVLILQVLSVNSISLSFSFITNHTLSFADYSAYINFLFVVFSLLLLYTHKEEINEKEEKDISNKWAYVILVGILVLFTWIKAPYFGYSFTGEHTMKYNTYVEPAKYMYENNNPFWYQRKYLANPVNNPEGIFYSFPDIPLNEWGLLSTFYIFPNNSIEVNTRLFTHSLGIIILISGFFFLKQILTNKSSLLITYLLSINPIINFSSFVTVEDSWSLIFTFLSLICLSKFIRNRKYDTLFLSGIFAGIGTANKISMFLWIFPIIAVLLALNKKKWLGFVKDILIVGMLSILPIIVHKTSIAILPKEPTKGIFLFVIWLLFFVFFYLAIRKYNKFLDKIIEFIFKKKFLVFILFSLAILIIIEFFRITNLHSFATNFLTDSRLILNPYVYKYMFFRQFPIYLTQPIFLLGNIGICSVFLNKNQQIKKLVIALLVGSITYWVAASKVIFFHNYYTNIIMTTFCITSGLLIISICKTYKSSFIPILVMIGFLIIPQSIQSTISHLELQISNLDSFEKVAEYIIENSKENEIYIDTNYYLSLTLMTGRPRTTGIPLKNEVKEYVKYKGLTATMNKYNIKYLITTKDYKDVYPMFIPLFDNDDISKDEKSYFRTEKILLRTDPRYVQEKVNPQIKDEDISEIKESVILEKSFEPYNIYSFTD